MLTGNEIKMSVFNILSRKNLFSKKFLREIHCLLFFSNINFDFLKDKIKGSF